MGWEYANISTFSRQAGVPPPPFYRNATPFARSNRRSLDPPHKMYSHKKGASREKRGSSSLHTYARPFPSQTFIVLMSVGGVNWVWGKREMLGCARPGRSLIWESVGGTCCVVLWNTFSFNVWLFGNEYLYIYIQLYRGLSILPSTHGQGRGEGGDVKTSPLPCKRKMGTHHKKSLISSTLYPLFLAFFLCMSLLPRSCSN